MKACDSRAVAKTIDPMKKNSMDVYRGIIRPRTFEALAYNGNVMTSAKRYARLAQKASKVVPLNSSVMVFGVGVCPQKQSATRNFPAYTVG